MPNSAVTFPTVPRSHHLETRHDETTRSLLRLARDGNREALDAVFARALPRLRRWAHGRLPPAARDDADTRDLMQDVALRSLIRLKRFEAAFDGAFDAYLRVSALNAIRDHARRVTRRPKYVALPDDLRASGPSPAETHLGHQARLRYRRALKRLRPRDRRLAIARIEYHWNIRRIQREFGFASNAAAGMALRRAMDRLIADLSESPSRSTG